MEIKPYPGWKNAVEKIMARVDEEGFGVLFSKKELLKWCDIEVPEKATALEWQNHQFEVLEHIDHMKGELLDDHDVCLFNVQGQGYQVLHPNDQVEKVPQKNLRRIRKEINKARKALSNVRVEQLNNEAQSLRLSAMTRFAFIRGAMNKRSLPAVPEVPKLG